LGHNIKNKEAESEREEESKVGKEDGTKTHRKNLKYSLQKPTEEATLKHPNRYMYYSIWNCTTAMQQ